MRFDLAKGSPPDAIFGLVQTFLADKRPNKMSLLVGFFRTEEGKTPVLPCVKEAEAALLEKEDAKEYLPIDGHAAYLARLGALIFGEKLWEHHQAQICCAQTVGGTGALSLFADFIKKEGAQEIWISDPTWANHLNIFPQAALKVVRYPYYDVQKQTLDFNALLNALAQAPKQAIILLHSNCHNPTGFDLSLDQWRELSELFLERELFPFFDMAYQGFGEGEEKDAAAVRYFLEAGHSLAVAYSCAKNFSLYGERVGALYVTGGNNCHNVQSELKALIRANYSNPPLHGAAIVAEILGSLSLKKSWQSELHAMRARMAQMRQAFVDALRRQNIPCDFMRQTKGLFCFTGLNKAQVQRLAESHAIYLPGDGRINITELNQSNLETVVSAIARVYGQTH
jgi:aspartate/tyrosine/aromatic aminotransferase